MYSLSAVHSYDLYHIQIKDIGVRMFFSSVLQHLLTPKVQSVPVLNLPALEVASLYVEMKFKVSRSAINLKIAIIIRFCMADELNGQALPVHHTNPYKNYNFQNDGTSRYFGLWL